MFYSRLIVTGLALLLALVAALWAAKPSSGAAPEAPYVVKPGDTLWAIAETRYAGDLREAVWRLRQRNHLDGSDLQPGQVLLLP